MTTFVAGWIHVPSLLGVKVFEVYVPDTFFAEVLQMFYEKRIICSMLWFK